MNSSSEINSSQNMNGLNENKFIPKKNRVIILAETHNTNEAVETWQKITDFMSLKKIIALDEALRNAVENEYHLPLEDFRIKEIGDLINDLTSFKKYNKERITSSDFIEMRIDDQNQISKNGIDNLKSYLNDFNLLLISFLSNDDLKNQVESKLNLHGRINTTGLIALAEQTFPAADKLYKNFEYTKDTAASKENVEELINIANVLFDGMPKIVDFYETFFNEQAKLILKNSPEYFPFFKNISRVLSEEIPVIPFTSTMRNVSMAKNIDSALAKFDCDIIVRVGQLHTVDCIKNYQTSIATILQKNYNIDPTRIVHQFVGPGFDLETYLSDCNFKFHQT